MAYLKPPLFVRVVFNRLALATGLGGSERLTVAGRTTGRPQTIPVIPITVEGVDYVVSTRGESQWVRNVRAAGELIVGKRTVSAEEVPVAERAPIISAYRTKAGKVVEGYWSELPDDADHPTFRLG